MSALDVAAVRTQFPALALTDDGHPRIYLDGAGGTQVPQRVIDAMSSYLFRHNANSHGSFRTSRETDALVESAHAAMADFLNAPSAREIVFGLNMTTLTFQFSRSIGRTLRAGDEIVITRLDHDANRAPWLALQEQGIVVKEVDFDTEDCTLLVDSSPRGAGPCLADLLGPRTRLVAVGLASNAVGTINPIRRIADMVHAVGGWLWVDAVHYAPHGSIDVQALVSDFLVCSSYKFFGPHAGVLWGREECLERLPAYKVRPAGDQPPDKFETGTPSFEAQAGVLAAIEYLADLGDKFGTGCAGEQPSAGGRRLSLKRAMAAIEAYERPLFKRFATGLSAIPGLRLYGIRDVTRFDQRTPTAAFRLDGHAPDAVAERLAERGIYVWAGNFYAVAVSERLGVEESGGFVRAGLVHYNTQEEVDTCLECLHEMAEEDPLAELSEKS